MKRIILCLAMLVMVSGESSATIVVDDDFESYSSQANFEATWIPIGTTAPISAEWSSAQASSPTHSVRVPGTAAPTNGQHRNRLTFSETGAVGLFSHIIWSFDIYDAAPTASPQRNFVNLQDTTAPTGTNQLISMGFNNNQSGTNSGGQRYMARILGYSLTQATPGVTPVPDPDGGPDETGTLGASPFFKLNDFGVGARSLGWHNLKVVISTNDGLSTDYAFFVDDVLAERVSNVGTTASFRSFDNITIGSGLSNGSTEFFVDNMRLEFVPEAVPEVGSFVAVGFCGLLSFGATSLRRRREPVVVLD